MTLRLLPLFAIMDDKGYDSFTVATKHVVSTCGRSSEKFHILRYALSLSDRPAEARSLLPPFMSYSNVDDKKLPYKKFIIIAIFLPRTF